MAELPAELIHVILANITDHITMINLALTSRLNYATAMPIVLAEESRYVREVMIPSKHLSIYEFPDTRSRLPAARLDSPGGPFTGTFRKVSFVSWQDSKYLCCIRRIVRRVKDLERIHMHVSQGALRSWVTAYLNICVGRPGVEFILDGGVGYLPIVVDGKPPLEKRFGPAAMAVKRLSLPFDHPLYVATAPIASSTTINGLSSKFQRQLKSTGTHYLNRPRPGSLSDSGGHGPIPPQIRALKLVNELLFSSRIARAVRALAAGKHITSFTLVNDHVHSHKDRHSQFMYQSDYQYFHYLHSQLQPDSAALQDIRSILAALSCPLLTHLSFVGLTPPPRALMQFLGPAFGPQGPRSGCRHRSVCHIRNDWRVDADLTPTAFHAKSRSSKWDRALGITLYAMAAGTGGEIVPTEWVPPIWQPWRSPELNAVFDVLCCAIGSSSSSCVLPWRTSYFKPSKSRSQNPPAANTIRLHSLILETFYWSHFINWLMLEAAKRQAWPVLSVNIDACGALDGLGRWCPELAREIETDERARVRAHYAGVSMDANANAATDPPAEPNAWPYADIDEPHTIEMDDFMQRLLKRMIWHTFPGLQMLQIGTDKRDHPPPQRLSRPVGL
ncbi:hypothetical protein D9619_005278 [Psilocybe cf. subviscida]|uniref:Uncharacterized protein n=1 Tax=Psilocybe cf. subviscida TaxID=2480587 RepID=A0A8H5FBL0_9AGAR|nr:hypothetical protein D9619_005278 [Psilocybe cf. subviscida]